MKTSGRSEELAARDANRALLKNGTYDAVISEISEYISPRGNDTLKCIVIAEGRTFTDYLTDTDLGGLKLRHCCAARGVLAKFDGGSIDPSDLLGPVRVKIGIEKKRGFRDRNIIEDYAPVAAAVTPLHAVGKIAGLVLSAAIAASLPSAVRAEAHPDRLQLAQAETPSPDVDMKNVKWWLYHPGEKSCKRTKGTPLDAYKALKNAKVELTSMPEGVMALVQGDDGTLALFDTQRACETIKTRLDKN